MSSNEPQVKVEVNQSEIGPSRTEHEILKRDVQWLKYGVAVSAGTGVFQVAMNLGAAPMPAAAAGTATAVIGMFR